MSEGLNDQEFEELKNRLREEFSGYYEKAGDRNYRFFHLKFVFKAVRRLAESDEISEQEFDSRVLEVSALFHDIGRSKDIEDGFMDPFEGHEGHAEEGSMIVSELVSDYLTESQLSRVEKIIKNHHSRPEKVEGKILQDADKLAKYGLSDVWRMIHYASEEHLTIEEGFENFRDTLEPRLEQSLDEFNFKHSRRIAEKRMAKQEEFISEMEREMNADDL